jgi:hypothetical protein
MNTNENFEKKKTNARAIVELGVALMSSSLVLFLITIFYCYAILIPALHNSLFGSLEALITIVDPLFIEMLFFVSDFILLLVGLLMRCRINIEEVFVMPFL